MPGGSVSKYTDEEKKQLVEKVQKEGREGWSIGRAAKNAGITYFMYNDWRKRFNIQDLRHTVEKPRQERTHRKNVDWESVFQDYEEHKSEVSQKEFCEQKGLYYPSFLSARHRLKVQGKGQPVRTIVPVALPNGTEEKLRMALAENLKLRSLVVDYALDIQAIKEWAGRK